MLFIILRAADSPPFQNVLRFDDSGPIAERLDRSPGSSEVTIDAVPGKISLDTRGGADIGVTSDNFYENYVRIALPVKNIFSATDFD